MQAAPTVWLQQVDQCFRLLILCKTRITQYCSWSNNAIHSALTVWLQQVDQRLHLLLLAQDFERTQTFSLCTTQPLARQEQHQHTQHAPYGSSRSISAFIFSSLPRISNVSVDLLTSRMLARKMAARSRSSPRCCVLHLTCRHLMHSNQENEYPGCWHRRWLPGHAARRAAVCVAPDLQQTMYAHGVSVNVLMSARMFWHRRWLPDHAARCVAACN